VGDEGDGTVSGFFYAHKAGRDCLTFSLVIPECGSGLVFHPPLLHLSASALLQQKVYSSSTLLPPLSSCLQRHLIAPNIPQSNFSFALAWSIDYRYPHGAQAMRQARRCPRHCPGHEGTICIDSSVGITFCGRRQQPIEYLPPMAGRGGPHNKSPRRGSGLLGGVFDGRPWVSTMAALGPLRIENRPLLAISR
jgi:hypothetical protein